LNPSAPDGFVIHPFAGDDPIQSRDYVRQRLGLEPFKPVNKSERPSAAPPRPPDEWVPILPVPADAPDLNAEQFCPAGFKLTKAYEYRDGERRLLHYVVRYDRQANGVAGEKAIRPITYCQGPGGRCGWRQKALPEDRPLYGLPGLTEKPKAPVVIVEGEKTADAVVKVFPQSVVLTWSGGANAVDKTDWSAMDGREHALLVPDADEPGSKAMLRVAHILARRGIPNIKIVEASFLPKAVSFLAVMA
jgi:hypothetical protein